MIDWFAEVARPRPVFRGGIRVAAVGISLLVNWSGAVRIDSLLREGRSAAAESAKRETSIDLRVVPFEERFVEPNPEVPVNQPDETVNFGSRDQQAAEPEPNLSGESDFPLRESEDESQTFVERGETVERLPPGVYSESAVPEAGGAGAAGRLGELAPPVEKKVPEWIEGQASGSGARIPEPREGEQNDPDEPERRPGTLVLNDGPADPAQPDPSRSVNDPAARPLPRKKVGAEVLLAPLNESGERAPRRGTLAVNSRLTDFGDYTQRTLEAIQAEWHRLVREVSVDSGSTFSSVQVKFRITRKGSVTDAGIVESTADPIGSMICLDAIHARAPFGAWTDEMVRILGDSTEMEITFHYR